MTTNYTLDNLTGKLLIASPNRLMDEVFGKSVIYVTAHSKEGAIGLVVNKMVNKVPFDVIVKMIDKTPPTVLGGELPIHIGGPVSPERGFLLHSTDYDRNLMVKCSNNLAISSNTEILADIATGNGPKNVMFLLGYTGWNEDQIQEEISQDLWIVSEPDDEIIFAGDNKTKWQSALKKAGINDTLFSNHSGFC
ncbi:MAG: YqgE/AlgH family protein [Proteobacteria bacterium]|nr:YqgE/AlgH family protein [Pseudomonadota bacterium]